jgi:CRP-like cAMP-binding protein
MVSPGELKPCSFFRDCPDAYLAKLADICQEESFLPEECIFREGEEAIKIYILIEGSVALQVQLKKYHHFVVSTMEEKGELFGWSAVVESKRYSATIKCLQQTRALSLKGEDLEKLFQEDPPLGLHFMKKIAGLIDQRLITLRHRLVSNIS